MALFNFRKLLSRKTKKSKPKSSKKPRGGAKKVGKRSRKAPSQNGKKAKKTMRRKKQKGGAGNYRLDVAKNCKIGGLPVVSPVNDCPKGVGVADPAFGTAIYTNPVVGGGRRSHTARKGTLKRKPSKRRK